VTLTSFCTPEQSLEFWGDRLRKAGMPTEKPEKRFGEEVLALSDPDGLVCPTSYQAAPPRITNISDSRVGVKFSAALGNAVGDLCSGNLRRLRETQCSDLRRGEELGYHSL
jgi:hypothetical protein